MRSRVTLTASAREDATISSISFYVDRDLIRQLRPGDEVHISRTACDCLGLSIIRMGELVAAIGAVTAVDLGRISRRSCSITSSNKLRKFLRK